MTPSARQWVAGGIALVLLLVLSFSAGRYTAPEKVRVETVFAKNEKAAEKVAEKKAKVVDRIVFVDRVVSSTGEVREKRTTRTLTDARETIDTAKTSESAVKSASSSSTTLRPDWRVGVLVGASLREPLLPIAGPLVLGASVERRIVGGLSAGAWLTTAGAAGASLSMEF